MVTNQRAWLNVAVHTRAREADAQTDRVHAAEPALVAERRSR